MDGSTLMDWMPFVALVVAVIFGAPALANNLAAWQERRRNTKKGSTRVQATINGTFYEDGLYSVQLHVVPSDENQVNFQYENWRIESATLLRPKSAFLFPAVGDDYASGELYADRPVRAIEGRVEGKPQRYALEFFISFQGSETAQSAVFKVIFSHTRNGKRHRATVSASVP